MDTIVTRNPSLVPATFFAQLVNLPRRAVTDLIASGMPVYGQGGQGKPSIINIADAWRWARANAPPRIGRPTENPSSDDPKYREREAMAGLREMKLAQAQGELIKIAAVEAYLADWIVTLRQNILNEDPGIMPAVAKHLRAAVAKIEADIDSGKFLSDLAG
jgi:phage terminase Nu1 subunit (DNA packaging protein)